MNANYPFDIDDELLEYYRENQTAVTASRMREKDPDELSDLFDSTAHFWLNDEPSDYPLHWHSRIEMILPLENDYTVVIEHQTYKISPGDIFIIPGGKLHHLIAPPEGLRFILIFDCDALLGINGFTVLSPWLSNPILINRDNCRPIYNDEAALISQMLRDYRTEDSLREVVIYNRLISFLINYARYQISRQKTSETPAAPSMTGRDRLHASPYRTHKNQIHALNTVMTYIADHYTEELTLEQAAAIAGFSKFHFSRLFKEFTGYTFYDYLMQKRIALSETLLAQPDTRITEIALQCGFSSLSTFNRTFKKIKGCTPSECRKLNNI